MSAASRILLAHAGAYPRNGDSSEEQILRKTSEAFARGERTIADLLDAENVVTRLLIHEQVRAGVELLTDGCARWADPIAHVAGKYSGITLGRTRKLPWSDAEYRVPRITGKLLRQADEQRSIAQEYRYARNALGLLPTSPERAGRLSLKPVLTGPYTLARCSESDLPGFGSVEARTEGFAELVAKEVGPLAAAGASIIQLDEPAILTAPGDWEVFRRAIAHIATVRDAAAQGGRRVQLALHVFGALQAELLPRLLKLPIEILGLDFTQEPGLVEALRSAGLDKGMGLAAGLVSGDFAGLEDEGGLRQTAASLLTLCEGHLTMGPASGMASLPRETAFAKLRSLAAVQAAMA